MPALTPCLRHRSSRAQRRAFALLSLVGGLLAANALLALPLIATGSEADILALVAPFRDEGEVQPGVTLASIRIDAQQIVMTLRGPAESADLILRPRTQRAPGSPAFDLTLSPAADAVLLAAQMSLRDAIVANDHGAFRFLDSIELNDAQDARSGVEAGPAMEVLRLVERVAAAFAWWFVIISAVLWAIRSARRRGRGGWREALAWAAVFGLAFWARARLGFDPLHANDHAWEDAAVALGVSGESGSEQRLNVIYGPAFRLAQQKLVVLFGAHLDALATVGALLGAAATVLLGLAARAVAGPVVAALAVLAMALSPLAVRVAASESDVVFGQFALAWVLAIAARPRGVPTGPVAAAGVVLLALGHVVGPGWAAGAAGLAVALRHASRRSPGLALGAAAADLAPQPFERHLLVGPRSWDDATREALGLTLWLGVAAAVLGSIRLLDAMPMLAAREAPDGVSISANPSMLLLLDADYASPVWFVLALVAMGGDLGMRLRPGRGLADGATALAGTVALWLGIAALAVSSLMIIACVSDGLRYQSVFLVAVLVLAARGAAVLRWLVRLPGRWTQAVLLALCLVAAVEAVRPRAGMYFQDAQIAAWRALRAVDSLPEETITLITPHQSHRGEAAPDAPRGLWSANGPRSRVLWADVVKSQCSSGTPLPPHSFLYRPPSCASIGADVAPCAALDALDAGGPSVAAGVVTIAQQWDRERPSGEFLVYETGSVPWSLRRAQCPPKAGARSGPGRPTSPAVQLP